jgi:hypothetical protein
VKGGVEISGDEGMIQVKREGGDEMLVYGEAEEWYREDMGEDEIDEVWVSLDRRMGLLN